MFSSTLRLLRSIIHKVHNLYVLHKYNDYTIAEYFRQQGAEIGENNRIMVQSLGQEPYLIKIGNHCSISAGVIFLNHDGGGWIFTEEIPSLQRFGKIEIKDNCYIGVNCTILANVTIGPNAVVGAGSMVTKDVPPNTVVCGNPARVVKTTEEYKRKIVQIWQEQTPAEYLIDIENGVAYSPEYIQKIKSKDYHILKKHLKTLFCKSQC